MSSCSLLQWGGSQKDAVPLSICASRVLAINGTMKIAGEGIGMHADSPGAGQYGDSLPTC